MRALLPLIIGTLGFALLYGTARAAVRRVYPRAWARAGARRAANLVPAAWAGALLLAFIARRLDMPRVSHASFSAAGAIVVLIACTLAPLVLAALVRRWAERRTPPEEVEAPRGTSADESAVEPSAPSAGTTRRELLVRTSAALPAGGVVIAGVGAVEGFGAAQLVQIEMTFPDLPEDLEGFRLLHYTDMHLGTYVDLLEVERLVELGRRAQADLVVLTGDMSDDLDRLLPALRRFESLDPRHGVLASIGNHEYFRGLKKSLLAYARTDVEMLIEQGVKLEIGRSRLFVGGADDPRVLRGDKMAFMHRTVNETLDGAPSDAFRVLLSHRPEGFVPAAQSGFHLTLSGHTHGAQLGFDGRSLLEGFMPDRFLWGAYQAGDKRLYTSSGAGHWFPFRIGCPREVPLIVLRRGPAGTVTKKTRLA